MMKLRRCIAFVILIGFAVVQFGVFQPAAATGPSWTFVGLFGNDPDHCLVGKAGFETEVNGLTDPSYWYDLIVAQNGHVFTDLYQQLSETNGSHHFWAPFGQSDRGLVTGSYPLTAGVPATVTFILKKLDGTVVWETVISFTCAPYAAHVTSSGAPSSSTAANAPDVPGAVTFFSPDDNRIDPHPGEQIAVWCNPKATPPTIVVYGIAPDQPDWQKGFFLATFKNADLLKAGAKGITQQAARGTVSMMQDGNGHFYVVWNDGQAHPSNQGDFAKSFTCTFNS